MTRRATAFYGASIASLAALGAFRWHTSAIGVPESRLSVPAAETRRSAVQGAAFDSAEAWTVDNDPFRLANAPSAVPYKPAADGGSTVAAYAPPPMRPQLILKGIVGGPPWQAIIDGMPGQPPGTIARSGSVFDKLKVRAVTRDSVIVQGPDTVWILSFRKY